MALVTKVEELYKPGIYAKITAPGAGTLLIPYTVESIQHSSTQKLSQPVQEFFQVLNTLVTDVSKKNEVFGSGEVVEAGLQLADLLGVKLYNKSYYASAWKGSDPSEVSLKFELHAGWRLEYSGATEVVEPLQTLYRASVPSTADNVNGTGFLYAPGPTVLSAAGDFITSYLVAGKMKETYDKRLAEENTQNKMEKGMSSKGLGGGLWEISFLSAYYPVATIENENPKMTSTTFLTLSDLVCRSASLELGTTVDTSGSPIKGSISFAFVSRDITVEANVNRMMRKV